MPPLLGSLLLLQFFWSGKKKHKVLEASRKRQSYEWHEHGKKDRFPSSSLTRPLSSLLSLLNINEGSAQEMRTGRCGTSLLQPIRDHVEMIRDDWGRVRVFALLVGQYAQAVFSESWTTITQLFFRRGQFPLMRNSSPISVEESLDAKHK